MFFFNYIRNVLIEDDETMVSFDVTSLYRNIPIIDTLNIIKDYINNDGQFSRKMAIPPDKLVLTTIWCAFNSQFYQQTGGVAIEDQHLQGNIFNIYGTIPSKQFGVFC